MGVSGRGHGQHFSEFHAGEVGLAPHVRSETHCTKLRNFQWNVFVYTRIQLEFWWRVMRQIELALDTRKLVKIWQGFERLG